MPHILQGGDLPDNFFLGQLFSGDMLVFQVVRAVYTAVDAVIGKIQRREHDDAVSVKIFFYLFGQIVELLNFVRHFAGQQNGGFPVGQPLAQPRLVQDTVYERSVFFILLRILQRVQNLLVGDEFFCF